MHAATGIAEAAGRHGWSRVEHKLHRYVLGRGVSRLVVGYSRTGRAVECALYFPEGFGTGYIDDPTQCHTVGGSGAGKLEAVLGWLAEVPYSRTVQAFGLVVIPCAARKLEHPAPARQLYNSAHFKLTLRAGEAHAAAGGSSLMILSAKHGLMGLDAVIDPYDVTIGHQRAVRAATLADQLQVRGVCVIESLLPKRYLATLRQASDILEQRCGNDVELIDLYHGAPGIGYQRAVLSSLLRTA